nr:hypothetical protein [Anaerolineae bacterium]NIN98196.1 hypothetical protein [Anaerolineae bacterium]NIQ79498.1 hypothetical protein [Anaerolineae bacterium]
KDPRPGNVWRPGTLNRYVYVGNNPVNHTDPSGLQGPEPHGTLEPIRRDYRDLTRWLVEELRTNASRPETKEIAELLRGRAWGLATEKWVDLVADRHTWDFKHAIKAKLRTDVIMLRHDGDSYGWYSHEAPGNINFGYVGRAAGWHGRLLHIGASKAQVEDPSHEGCVIPIPVLWNREACPLGLREVRWEWRGTWFDNPEDYQAIEFGVLLHESHPVGLTVPQFQAFLRSHRHLLASHAPPDRVRVHTIREDWPWIDALLEDYPYDWGYFNGPKGPRLSG